MHSKNNPSTNAKRRYKLQGTFATDSKMQVLEHSIYIALPVTTTQSDDYGSVTTPVKTTPKIPALASTKQTLQVES